MMENKEFIIESIGIIHSPFKTKEECPIQGIVSEAIGRIEIFPEFQKGLETIETFSHLYLFYLFDRAGEIRLSRPTFLDDKNHGVFASRHPCRPNGIGMTIVRLESVSGLELGIRGIDVLDQTPLIDIKPYLPKFDYFKDANNGWVDGAVNRPKPPGRE